MGIIKIIDTILKNEITAFLIKPKNHRRFVICIYHKIIFIYFASFKML